MSEFTDDLKHIARFDTPRDPRKACLEAADRIEALEAENERLLKAVHAAKSLCDNIAEFDTITDAIYLSDAWDAIDAAIPHP